MSLNNLSNANIRTLFPFLTSHDILVMMLVSESLQKLVIQHTKALIVDHKSLSQCYHQLCHCKNLQALGISDATVTNASIIAIAVNCASLTSLDVSHCSKLTNASIIAIANHCASLTSLDVSHCQKLTNASIIATAHHLCVIGVVKCYYALSKIVQRLHHCYSVRLCVIDVVRC